MGPNIGRNHPEFGRHGTNWVVDVAEHVAKLSRLTGVVSNLPKTGRTRSNIARNCPEFGRRPEIVATSTSVDAPQLSSSTHSLGRHRPNFGRTASLFEPTSIVAEKTPGRRRPHIGRSHASRVRSCRVDPRNKPERIKSERISHRNGETGTACCRRLRRHVGG